MNFYPVFLREMIIFKRRLSRPSFLFSSLITPLLYLVAFGLGLGGLITIKGLHYLTFIMPGICGVSSMINSYIWVALSVSVGRLHLKTFDHFLISPITSFSLMLGEVLSGVVRGLFASGLVIIAGVLLGTGLPRHPFFWIFLLINCLTFASLGVIVGFLVKSHEDTIIFSNLFILPMAFFCGTFFPLDRLPLIIKYPLYLLPLTHVNVGLRTSFLGEGACLLSLGIMLFVFVALFTAGSIIIKRHDT